jgi:hypothetical protein
MNVSRQLSVALAALTLGLVLPASAAHAQAHAPSAIVVPAQKVAWAPAPPFLPAGADISVLEGDPSAKGPVTLRLRFPANYDIPAHWHSMTERVTVLTGALHVGMGDRIDRAASQTLDPGGFVALPASMHHFAWTNSPTTVQINLEGPFDIFYVNPAEDPQHPTSQVR